MCNPVLQIELLQFIAFALKNNLQFGTFLSLITTCRGAFEWAIPALNESYTEWTCGKGPVFEACVPNRNAGKVYMALRWLSEYHRAKNGRNEVLMREKQQSIVYNLIHYIHIRTSLNRSSMTKMLTSKSTCGSNHYYSKDSGVTKLITSKSTCGSIYYFSKDGSRIKSILEKKNLREAIISPDISLLVSDMIDRKPDAGDRIAYKKTDVTLRSHDYRQRQVLHSVIGKYIPYVKVTKKSFFTNLVIKDKKTKKKEMLFANKSFRDRCFSLYKRYSKRDAKANHTAILHELNGNQLKSRAKSSLCDALLMRV